MFGLGENYLSAMAVFMGFTALQISILNSLPQLVGAFAQLATHSLTRAFSSMKVFVVSLSLVQSFMWVVLIYIISQTSSYTVILSWSVTYYAISSIIGPAWISWMGYLVPLRIRANYHANRNRIIHFIIFISILIGGLILKIFQDNMVLGFSIMFGVGSFGRLISSYYLNKKNDTRDISVNRDYSYRDILADKTKVIFIIYNTSIHFSVMFLGPLFTIYILRTMELSYFVLTLCMVSWWMGNVFSSRMWGRLSKKKGNLYLLKLSTLLMCILPALWISVYYFGPIGRVVISLIINLMAGISFAAFGLSSFNILYDMCSNDEVIKFSSLINCLKGVGVFTGSVIAGMIVDSNYIMETLSQYNFTSIQLSMLISIILRSMSLMFLSNLKVKT